MTQYDASKGQIGFRIVLQLMDRDPLTGALSPADISAASTKEIDLEKPSGTKVTFSGGDVTFTPSPIGAGNGSDGMIEAATVAGTLDEEGTYKVAGYIVDALGTGPSQIATFTVGPSLR